MPTDERRLPAKRGKNNARFLELHAAGLSTIGDQSGIYATTIVADAFGCNSEGNSSQVFCDLLRYLRLRLALKIHARSRKLEVYINEKFDTVRRNATFIFQRNWALRHLLGRNCPVARPAD